MARFRQTFSSAAEAARVYFEGNALFLDYVHDPIDGLRDWADGIDVRVGSAATRRLSKSAAGAKIFEADQGPPQIRAALRWVFQQAQSRRWDAVDWDAVDALGESLAPYWEPSEREASMPGLYWRPLVGGRPVAELLDELDPHTLLELGREESRQRLAQSVDALGEAYDVARECLSPAMRRVVESRIAEWSGWLDDESQVPEYACDPDLAAGGYVCDYPLVLGELAELRGACRQAYNPGWFAEDLDAPGYPPSPSDPRGPAPEPEEEPEIAGPREDVPAPTEAPPEPSADACPPEDLRQLEADGRAYGGPDRDLVDVREIGGVLYQLEYRTCGKRNRITGAAWCRCMRDPPEKHGPYWYAYWRRAGGRRVSRYIGLKFSEV